VGCEQRDTAELIPGCDLKSIFLVGFLLSNRKIIYYPFKLAKGRYLESLAFSIETSFVKNETFLRHTYLNLGLDYFHLPRVIETAARVRLAFAAACPDAALFRQLAVRLMPAGP
jgi:hypothetical protein